MIKNTVITASVPAATGTEMLLGTLTVPKGHNYNAVEIGVQLSALCIVYVYVENERVLTFNGNLNADVQRRILNWNIKEGILIQVTATNADAFAQNLGVELSFDDLSA
jgi:hypothetical protein